MTLLLTCALLVLGVLASLSTGNVHHYWYCLYRALVKRQTKQTFKEALTIEYYVIYPNTLHNKSMIKVKKFPLN